MDLLTIKAPPSTPTDIDAVHQISEAVETLCSSMETGSRVMCLHVHEVDNVCQHPS